MAELHFEDRDFLRAMFVASFEGVKMTSALRTRVQEYVRNGSDNVKAGLLKGLSDGSVRTDVDLERAAREISAAVFGLAYQWALLPDDYDFERELDYVRARFVAAYSSTAEG
ncbi:TetR family transcriptional regulator C-terminal domain-containing protein [Mycolicibacter sp. MYC123]|uniref:TetR family transcriptional regulator C-terminal domain-containing protein n=1 Tax=[Mycobacterium] zoologicum TaxID=2872311 RepID=A0ABU5YJ08_9MYCO|nr:TetR family transcriptional regulator C-terminal domain-containing protein [Mycolicibacter sp. MYC123]MEB3049826.1 TetR family transcriptional regulator C-terminal domain-containing protein [Mycolicibacter sp. MYC123]